MLPFFHKLNENLCFFLHMVSNVCDLQSCHWLEMIMLSMPSKKKIKPLLCSSPFAAYTPDLLPLPLGPSASTARESSSSLLCMPPFLHLTHSWQGDFSPPYFPFSSLINFGPDVQSPISQHVFDWREPLINLRRMKSSPGHLLCLAFNIPHIPPLSAE